MPRGPQLNDIAKNFQREIALASKVLPPLSQERYALSLIQSHLEPFTGPSWFGFIMTFINIPE